MPSSNYIKNVAIVGAGGRSGGFMAAELLKTGKHTVTAITRKDSDSKLPEGVKTGSINYDDPSTIVEALNGQDALIITMGTRAPPDTQSKLIQAAADAGVPWVLPNEWAPDTANDELCKDVFFFQKLADVRKEIEKVGKSSYLAVTTGFWYEWSLAIANSYGFDIPNRKVTFFDDGETKINTSTWPQVGRAVAALLSLPIKPEGGEKKHSLEHFRNKNVYISSFTVNQKDMLASLLRVTGTKESDWEITSEPAKERYEKAAAAMKQGDQAAFARWMYSPVFYKNDAGLYEKARGLANGLLGLPEEDIDEATKVAIERSQGNPYA